jgi:hypothetical protein
VLLQEALLSERFVQVLSDRLKASTTIRANLVGAEDIHTVNVSLKINTVNTSQCENTEVVSRSENYNSPPRRIYITLWCTRWHPNEGRHAGG